MKLSDLKKIVEEYKGKEDHHNILKDLRKIIKTHEQSKATKIDHKTLFQFITKSKLFYENEDVPPRCIYPSSEFSELVDGLKRGICQDIAPDLNSLNQARLNKGLGCLQRENILTEICFDTLQGKGELAIEIINGWLSLHSSGMSNLQQPLVKAFSKLSSEQVYKVTLAMHMLAHEKNLHKQSLKIIIDNPDHAIPLQQGLQSIYKNKVTPAYISLLIADAPNANFIGWGLSTLKNKGIDSKVNCDSTIKASRDANCFAGVLCSLHDMDPSKNLLNKKNRNTAFEQKEYLFYLDSLLQRLKAANLLNQNNFDALIAVAKHSLGICLWWISLESTIETQANFELLCQMSEILNQENVLSANRDLRLKLTTSSYGEITQEHFNTIISICKKSKNDVTKASNDVADYLQNLIKTHRNSIPSYVLMMQSLSQKEMKEDSNNYSPMEIEPSSQKNTASRRIDVQVSLSPLSVKIKF